MSERYIKPEIPDYVKVYPSNKLNGDVRIPGDKVAAVHILLATTILSEKSKINNIHYCGDVNRLLDWIESIDLAHLDKRQEYLEVIPNKQPDYIDLSDLADTRSNICLVTALAIRHNKVLFKGTQGCNFTDRKIDRHYDLMSAFGLEVKEDNDIYSITSVGYDKPIDFDCSTNQYGPSVGVTCHALIASLTYRNQITLTNAALESAPLTLIKYIQNSTNRSIRVNNRTITINKVDEILHIPNEINLPPDVTVASTYISALVAAKNGEILLHNIGVSELPASVVDAYKSIGIQFSSDHERRTKVQMEKNRLTNPVEEIICDVIPNFPSDIGPIYTASIAGLNGISSITDRVYDNRSSHVEGLNQIGYNLVAQDNRIIIYGHTASRRDNIIVDAKDIRTGAALVVGAIGSNSDCVKIREYRQIYRGYADLIKDLQSLGVKIEVF